MFFTIMYFLKRAIREGAKSLAVPLLAFTLIVLINTLGGIKEWLDFEYNNTMDNHPIIAELSDLSGDNTDNLSIELETINLFADPDSDSALSLYGFTGELILKRSLDVTIGGGQKETTLAGILSVAAEDNLDPETGAVITYFEGYDKNIFTTKQLVCVAGEEILPFLEDGKLSVTASVKTKGLYDFYPDPEFNPGARLGWDMSDRMYLTHEIEEGVWTTNPILGLSYSSLFAAFDGIDLNEEYKVTWPLTVSFTGSTDVYLLYLVLQYTPGEILSSDMSLTVIGTVSNAEESIVYCPFWTVLDFLEELNVEYIDMQMKQLEEADHNISEPGRPVFNYIDNLPITSNQLSIVLSDNRELVEFKELASLSFSRVRPVRSTLPYAMTIYDSTFYETIEPLLQNTILVDIAIPIVYVIAVSVGFLASTLLTRQRKSEFAVMRSVGIHRRDVFFGVFSEQLILSLIGAFLGCALTLLIFRDLLFERPAILLGCYLLGTIFAAIRVAGTNVLKVMKEKE